MSCGLRDFCLSSAWPARLERDAAGRLVARPAASPLTAEQAGVLVPAVLDTGRGALFCWHEPLGMALSPLQAAAWLIEPLLSGGAMALAIAETLVGSSDPDLWRPWGLARAEVGSGNPGVAALVRGYGIMMDGVEAARLHATLAATLQRFPGRGWAAGLAVPSRGNEDVQVIRGLGAQIQFSAFTSRLGVAQGWLLLEEGRAGGGGDALLALGAASTAAVSRWLGAVSPGRDWTISERPDGSWTISLGTTASGQAPEAFCLRPWSVLVPSSWAAPGAPLTALSFDVGDWLARTQSPGAFFSLSWLFTEILTLLGSAGCAAMARQAKARLHHALATDPSRLWGELGVYVRLTGLSALRAD